MRNYMDKECDIRGNVVPRTLGSRGQLVPGREVRFVFRYGCCSDRPARDGSPAYVIDVYLRHAIVTGRALVSAHLEFTNAEELVEVDGIVIR